jgi:hypothetical protein
MAEGRSEPGEPLLHRHARARPAHPSFEFKSKKRISPIAAAAIVPECQTEVQAMAALLGPLMVLIFCLSQAFAMCISPASFRDLISLPSLQLHSVCRL